jgi:hypothetical protein
MLTLLAGCGATVLLDQFRRYAKRRAWITDDWPDKWWLYILLAFLCFASFQAWEDQHTSNIGRQTDLHGKDLALQKETMKLMQSENNNSLLSRLYNSQQETINSCFMSLSNFSKPEPRIITALILDNDEATKRNRMLLLINKTVTPVNLFVTCDQNVGNDPKVDILGVGRINGWAEKVASNAIQVKIDGPAWSPISPMTLAFSYANKGPTCMFTER